MAWTYGGDPSASARDAVRFLIGDTDTDDQQLQDAEIAYLLAAHGSANAAAVAAARALYARYARLADTTVDDVQVRASQRRDGYRELVGQLQTQASRLGVSPYCGGISEAQKETAELDTDRVQPIFTRDLHVVSPSLPLRGDDD